MYQSNLSKEAREYKSKNESLGLRVSKITICGKPKIAITTCHGVIRSNGEADLYLSLAQNKQLLHTSSVLCHDS